MGDTQGHQCRGPLNTFGDGLLGSQGQSKIASRLETTLYFLSGSFWRGFDSLNSEKMIVIIIAFHNSSHSKGLEPL